MLTIIFFGIGKLCNAPNFQGGATETEVLCLVKERDELKVALLDLENHMEDIQDNMKTLFDERDRLKALLTQVSLRNINPPDVNSTFEDQMLSSI